MNVRSIKKFFFRESVKEKLIVGIILILITIILPFLLKKMSSKNIYLEPFNFLIRQKINLWIFLILIFSYCLVMRMRGRRLNRRHLKILSLFAPTGNIRVNFKLITLVSKSREKLPGKKHYDLLNHIIKLLKNGYIELDCFVGPDKIPKYMITEKGINLLRKKKFI